MKINRLLKVLLMISTLPLLCSCNSASGEEYSEAAEEMLPAATEYYNNKYDTDSVVETDSIRTWDMMTLNTSEIWYKATDEDGNEYKIVYDKDEERFYDDRQRNEIQLALEDYYYQNLMAFEDEIIYGSVVIKGKTCGTNGTWYVFSSFYDGDMEAFLKNEPNIIIRAGYITYIVDSADLDGSLKEKEEAAAREGTGTLVAANHGFEERVEKLCVFLTSFGNVEGTEISVISSETAGMRDDNDSKFILPFHEGCEYFVEFYNIQYPDKTIYNQRFFYQDKIYLNKGIFVGVYSDRYQIREGDIVIEELNVSSDSLSKWKNNTDFPKEDCYIYKITPGDNLLQYMNEEGLSNIQIRFQYPDRTTFYKITTTSEIITRISENEENVQWGELLNKEDYVILMIPK